MKINDQKGIAQVILLVLVAAAASVTLLASVATQSRQTLQKSAYVPECVEQEKTCDGNLAKRCDSGKWVTSMCALGCTNGSCNSCQADNSCAQYTCRGETCANNCGTAVNGTKDCSTSRCPAEGATRCKDETTVEKCSGTGAWETDQNCNYKCRGGICVSAPVNTPVPTVRPTAIPTIALYCGTHSVGQQWCDNYGQLCTCIQITQKTAVLNCTLNSKRCAAAPTPTPVTCNGFPAGSKECTNGNAFSYQQCEGTGVWTEHVCPSPKWCADYGDGAICAPPLSAKEPCAWDFQCASEKCNSLNRCGYVSKGGECHALSDCMYPLSCISGICKNVSFACRTDNDCSLGSCFKGKCIPSGRGTTPN